MRYAELDNRNLVRFILPPELADDYPILPPNCIEIPADSPVKCGELWTGSDFIRPEVDFAIVEARSAFNNVRAQLFADTEWVRQRHSDRTELEIEDVNNWAGWLIYWQALRDMPDEEGFDPRNPKWPPMPE